MKALVVKNLPSNAGHANHASSIPGLGRSPGAGNGNPLQYPYLENSINREAWLGYSPCGSKELELSTHAYQTCFTESHFLPLQLYKSVIQGNVVNLIAGWGN